MKLKLYLVSTPIGNYDDISIRALKILKNSDYIICEEYREARRLLSVHNISKELISLNEHNEKEIAPEVIELIKSGKNLSLISDCGTPLFSDPGHYLAELCIANGIELIPVPGANSLIPALVGSGLDIERFYYYGWISPKKDKRKSELIELKKVKQLIILMDTPYRLRNLLSSVKNVFGASKKCVLAYNLTMKSEHIYRGKISDVLNMAEAQKLKGEFVLLIDNR